MEIVTVKRPSVIEDEYGNEVDGPLSVVKTVMAEVAPQIAGEPKLLGRTPIETNYNVYLFGSTDSGILATDTLTIRGEDTPVDGRIARWLEPPAGEHIQVRLVNG